MNNFYNLLASCTFTSLFLMMVSYWSQAAFFGQEKYKIFNNFVSLFSISLLSLLLIVRWIESGHFPLSNLYESLLFLSWCFLAVKGLFQVKERELGFSNLGVAVILTPLALLNFGFAFLTLPKEMQQATALVPALQSNWLMMHVTVMVLSYAALLSGSLLSIAFLILNRLETPKRLYAESLQEELLTSKGVLSSLPSFSFEDSKRDKGGVRPPFLDLFLQDRHNKNEKELQFPYHYKSTICIKSDKSWGLLRGFATQQGQSEALHTNHRFVSKRREDLQEDLQEALYTPEPMQDVALSVTDRLDNYSYRILALGFPLLTIGILSGAVWANEAWGSYWSWDPKETWAFITWIVFAIYLHTRITKGWSGEKPAIVASIGFFMVWFCYLGVNLLGTGVHSYGWFSK